MNVVKYTLIYTTESSVSIEFNEDVPDINTIERIKSRLFEQARWPDYMPDRPTVRIVRYERNGVEIP